MNEIELLRKLRLKNWRQDGGRKVENPEQAIEFLREVGIATLYGASPEFPSLYQAHMSDPEPPSFATWDSPSGYVYTWRWEIGRPHAAFYGVVVAKKPTWVAFDRLPAVLGALMERRSPGELYQSGELSQDALRVAEAFDGTEGVLSTKELRDRAGFEKGKESRAAYLKAVEELDSRLWLAKRFGDNAEGDEMLHALVSMTYPEAFNTARTKEPVVALAEMFAGVLRSSVYLDPTPLSRHLRADSRSLEAAFARLEAAGAVRRLPLGKGFVYVSEEYL